MADIIVNNLKSKQRTAALIADPLLTAAKPRKLQQVYRILAAEDNLEVRFSHLVL
jgi:hypothetical protein